MPSAKSERQMVPADSPVRTGSEPVVVAAGDLAAEAAREIADLDHELAEIEMLINQAKIEAGRQETRRAQVAEKVAGLRPGGVPKEAADLSSQLVTLTRRASVMAAQVDILEGKQKSLARYRDSLARYGERLAALAEESASGMTLTAAAAGLPAPGGSAAVETLLPASVSRLVLAAQEDLRREIARGMHDGPAQSLTNIVLQAQIVEHLMARDPEVARNEVRLLVSMVQNTLEATKSFIFDVRPMVLDDLGLVPTLRRAARERGRRAQRPVEFDSIGADRRLPMELESGLFRIIDEALAAYLDARPDRVSIRLDWGDRLEARIRATREAREPELPPEPVAPPPGADVPPALAAMMEERQAARQASIERARAEGRVVLPPPAWREIQQRASTIGVTAALVEDGAEVRLEADVRTEG